MQLLIMNGERAGEHIELVPPKMSIGRELDNDISLLVIGMSRYHAELEFKPPSWILRDVGSTNGIKINGEKVNHNYSVRHDDEIEIGRIKLKYDKTPVKKEEKKPEKKVIKAKLITKPNAEKTEVQEESISNPAKELKSETVVIEMPKEDSSSATSIDIKADMKAEDEALVAKFKADAEAKADIEAKVEKNAKPKLSLKKEPIQKEEPKSEEQPKEESELDAQKRRLSELRKKRSKMKQTNKNLPPINKDAKIEDVATNTRNINKKAFQKFFDK